jgi:aromatic ring-cleaving dioxygenase
MVVQVLTISNTRDHTHRGVWLGAEMAVEDTIITIMPVQMGLMESKYS